MSKKQLKIKAEASGESHQRHAELIHLLRKVNQRFTVLFASKIMSRFVIVLNVNTQTSSCPETPDTTALSHTP